VEKPPKVFCSHRQVDKPAVEAFARRLRERGINAWLDKWEVQPGHDFVQRINEGLADYDVGLVFFSSAPWPGKWFAAEVSTITLFQVEEGRRLIPVMLDDQAPLPALLRPYARRSAADIDQIVEAIFGHNRKPPLGSAVTQPTRLQFTLRLSRDPAGAMRIEALRNGSSVAQQDGVIISPTLRQAFDEFVRGQLKAPPQSASQQLTPLRANDLTTLGDQLGQALCPGGVGTALSLALQAVNTTSTLDLCFESADPALLALPFEALRLDGQTPALLPGVSVRRRVADAPAAAWAAAPSPLKILVAVGAPDEGKTQNTVLDLEHELQRILDAVEPRARQGNAEVRFLEVGHPEQIRKALQNDAYHVLHLSGHGGPGSIELEDEDGAPVSVTAAELVRHLQAAHRNVPLIFLSSCFGATPGAEAGAMATELVRAGVPFVVAMQAGVTDRYASALAHAFYAALAEREYPQPAQALATARQALEQARQQALQRGGTAGQEQAEYATAALYCAGEDVALVDFAAERRPLSTPPVHQAVGPMPSLRIGDLVGRRQELRAVLRVLRDHPDSMTEHGRLNGVVLTGIGGVGKSAIAGRAMARLQEEGWAVAAVAGRLAPAPLCAAVAATLLPHANPALAQAGQQLSNSNLDDSTRLSLICALLQQTPLLLVLDNFEDNLAPGGQAFLDAAVQQLLVQLAGCAQRGRLLITCRYPLPGMEAEFLQRPVPPLSAAEVRKLLWRLESLKGLDRADVAEVMRHVGGHPRMLEFLDGLLRHGAARLPDVRRRLREVAHAAGIDLKVAPADLSEALRSTALLGARTVFLDELLALARNQGDEEPVRQLAVSALPMTAAELAQALGAAPASQAAAQAMNQCLERLVSLSLATPLPQGYWVHRWTAEALAQTATPEDQRQRCRRAGEFRLARPQGQEIEYDDICEATYNFLDGSEFDRACGLALQIANFHIQRQQTIAAVALASDVLRRLPNSTHGWAPLADIEVRGSLQLGLTDRALELTREMTQVFENRLQQEPQRADYQRDLSVSYNRLGDLMRDLGQGEQAREFFEKDLAIAKRLAEAEPQRADYQRDLSVSYDRLGDLMRDLGQGEQAREFFENSLAIRTRLAEAEPQRADYQRDLSVPYERLGDLMRDLGQSEQAREFFENSLAIWTKLAKDEPQRADYQRGLSVSYNKLGDLMRVLGQGEQARAFFENSLAIRTRLAEAEPQRADYQRDLSVSYERLGDLMRDLDQGEQAREFFENSLAIWTRLTKAEPQRADYQRGLCVSLSRCAQIRGGAQGAALAAQAAALAHELQDSGRLSATDASLVTALDALVESIANG
jgi:tetratricopeptide (TPR) repeat protein